MKKSLLFIPVLFLVLIGLNSSCFTVNETEQAIVTQFGKIIGEPITTPGLKFKIPLIQTVTRIEKRILEWDGQVNEMPTKDKTYISVDTFARWRITDPKTYFLRLRDERSAQSRLDDLLGSETRKPIARHELIEIVRSDKERQAVVDEAIKAAAQASGQSGQSRIGQLPQIRVGRLQIEKDILNGAKPKLAEFGIELLDVRFKRINYNIDVLQRVYARMISERQQIASRFRSEGEGEAAKILGQKERDLADIESGAYRKVQELKGTAEGEAASIYAKSFTSKPEAAEFYRFLKGLETLKTTVTSDTSLILSTQSDLLSLLKKAEAPSATPAPAAAPAEAQAAPAN